MEKLYYGYYKSPIGNLRIVVDENSLVALDFNEDEKKQSDEHSYIKEVKNQLDEYFKGKRELFDLKIKLNGTDFQNKVWSELTKIPYGETISYKELATRIGNDKACRAVGNANNKNKISIVIPCHRVVGSNKKLVGYAGGLEKKEWLINHENKVTNE